MKLTEAQKKTLTELIDETLQPDDYSYYECQKCHWRVPIYNKKPNVSFSQYRTFLTPDDQQKCIDKLVEKELWEKFWNYAWEKAPYGEHAPGWIIRPTVNGYPHFCLLVADFLEVKHGQE